MNSWEQVWLWYWPNCFVLQNNGPTHSDCILHHCWYEKFPQDSFQRLIKWHLEHALQKLEPKLRQRLFSRHCAHRAISAVWKWTRSLFLQKANLIFQLNTCSLMLIWIFHPRVYQHLRQEWFLFVFLGSWIWSGKVFKDQVVAIRNLCSILIRTSLCFSDTNRWWPQVRSWYYVAVTSLDLFWSWKRR